MCKAYSNTSTLYENIRYKKSKSCESLRNQGYFEYDYKCSILNGYYSFEEYKVNKYLTIRLLPEEFIYKLISEVFNSKFRNYIQNKTGFCYSIDYLIAYDRDPIKSEDKAVSTLKQWYSYVWHYDKPNSQNMLKIIIPINISSEHGPLEVISNSKSSKIKKINKILDNELETYKFIGNLDKLFGFLPNVCIHRDGIPKFNKKASQIMFQLNPSKEWVINSRISTRQPSLNKSLKIWTTEPKFPLIAYRSDKRIKFS
ncbi:hypothetical protein HA150_07195 [Prochlorococcus marinus XMU1414]|uniref:Uncharacterized protein n=1 Tax=Prochlorococcus marinus XMU1424 TaxID=2774497 RepID=A0A9D9FZ95_PROMR|nr:hypothetical protein [Prochlorococcus marinus]MBO8228684.1 hypothetical protein [Prochlorococcus marinus XMU1414]MCR8531545.1 hypothetical protein [Prochlorococcus marinus XMU1420]MCR8535274.1 hypothetical protein [Prochlorococcus marinus XMU1424]